MKNISVITSTIKISSSDQPNTGDVVFREVELHNSQPAFLILAFNPSQPLDNLNEKAAHSFEIIINSLKTNISLGNLEALKTAFSEGLSLLNDPNSSLVAIIDQTIYALTKGLGQVYLKRHSQFGTIVHNPTLSESESEAQSHIIRTASGPWQENDIIILSSSYHPVLKNSLKSLDYQDTDLIESQLRQHVDIEVLNQSTLGICRIITLSDTPKNQPITYDNLQDVNQNIVSPSSEPDQETTPDVELMPEFSPEHKRLQSRVKRPNLTEIFSDPRKAKKTYGLLTLVLIALLTTKLFLAFTGVTQESKNLQSQELLAEAQTEYQQAVPLVISNPPLARNKLITAQNKLNNILALTPNNESAKILLAKIQDSISQTLNVKDTLISEFIKLDLIKTGSTGSSLDLDGRTLNVLDSQNGSLYQINIDRKSTEIVGGGELVKNAQFVAGSLGRTFAYKESSGITRSTRGESKTELVIDSKDQSWGKINSIASFGGNVYTLDSSNNQVWKYTPTDTAFSTKSNYIKDEVSRDISDGIDMSIDGSVWILTASENIYNFLPDSGTSFPTSGLDKKIGTNAKIYSDSESTDLIYILDPDNSRVIAFGKTGGYKLQYQDPQIAQAVDIAVSEKDQTIFLLTNQSILAIKL